MAEAEAVTVTPRSPLPRVPLLLALVNLVAIAIATGAIIYTKIIYQRHPITEESERKRLTDTYQSSKNVSDSGYVTFEPFTVNILANPANPRLEAGTDSQIAGKQHYAYVGFALELRDIKSKERVEKLKPLLMDRLLYLFGKKSYQELVTVQGRYVLRIEIQDLTNKQMGDFLVSNVFFTEFTVQ